MNLKSTTDFVLEQEQNYAHVTRDIKKNPFLLVVDYAKFLKQPLKLEMFVPTDEEGRIWEAPKGCCSGRECGCMGQPINYFSREDIDKYYELESKVLFKDFSLIKSDIETLNHTTFIQNLKGEQVGSNKSWEDQWNLYGIVIEDLIGFEIELTESCIKKLF